MMGISHSQVKLNAAHQSATCCNRSKASVASLRKLLSPLCGLLLRRFDLNFKI